MSVSLMEPARKHLLPPLSRSDPAIVTAKRARCCPGGFSPDVTQVVLNDIHAPLVTIALDEAALAPPVPLLRIPYLERLLEAVRSGTPSDGLTEAMRPAACQAHDDFATYLTELVLGLFDGEQLRGLQGPFEPFRALADPITCAGHSSRRCGTWQMLLQPYQMMSIPYQVDCFAWSGAPAKAMRSPFDCEQCTSSCHSQLRLACVVPHRVVALQCLLKSTCRRSHLTPVRCMSRVTCGIGCRYWVPLTITRCPSFLRTHSWLISTALGGVLSSSCTCCGKGPSPSWLRSPLLSGSYMTLRRRGTPR